MLLLVGDSFVQGVGADDDETLGWRLAAALPGRHVINLGVAGYGSDQELLSVGDFFNNAGAAIVSDIVVVVYENDFRDVQSSFDYALARSKPLFHLNGQRLERGSYRLSRLDRLMDASALAWLTRTKLMYHFRPAEPSVERGLDLVVACLQEIERLGSVHSTRVHLFAHRQLGPPYGHASEVNDSVWNAFLRRTGARDITDAIRAGTGASPIGFDGLHWSAEGTRRATSEILRSLTSAPLP